MHAVRSSKTKNLFNSPKSTPPSSSLTITKEPCFIYQEEVNVKSCSSCARAINELEPIVIREQQPPKKAYCLTNQI